MNAMKLKPLDARARRSGVGAKTMSYNDIQVIARTIIDDLPFVAATDDPKKSETPPNPSKMKSLRQSFTQFCCCSSPKPEERGDDVDDNPKKQNAGRSVDEVKNPDLLEGREKKKDLFVDNILEVALERVISIDPVFQLVGKNARLRPDGYGPSASTSRITFE